MALLEQNKLNSLLSKGIPHGVYFSSWMTDNGWSKHLVQSYCDNGWLARLCRGVVHRIGDRVDAYSIIASYLMQVGNDMHIAAHSALELHGFMHFVPMGKPRVMVALHGNMRRNGRRHDRYDFFV